MIFFRSMTPEDIPSCLGLCRHAGWNQLADDWKLFLTLSPNGCTVAVDRDRVIGTVTTVNYGDSFGWIGMVLVDPEFQRKGTGSQLLKIAIETLSNESSVRLDATPAGREVYLKLGFVDEFPLVRLQASDAGDLPESRRARHIVPTDMEMIVAWDMKVFGANRRAILSWLLERFPEFAFVIEEAGRIRGYSFGRPGFIKRHIGPIIAEDMEIASALVAASLKAGDNRSVILDVPKQKEEWLERLKAIGFSEQRNLMRMCRGKLATASGLDSLFAILGPEFG